MSTPTPFLTIEAIFTRSFSITAKLYKHFLVLYLALIGATAASNSILASSEDLPLQFLTMGAVVIAGMYLSIASAIVAFQLWRGEEPEVPEQTLKKIDLLLIFETIWMTIRITLTSIPLFLCLIIPGLVYVVNRLLAIYILISERSTVSQALRESRRLMTAEPWYSINGPQLRVTGLLLAVTFFSLAVGLFAIVMAVVVSIIAALMPPPIGGVTAKLILLLGSAALQQFMTIFNSVIIVGFCIDLKNRYRLIPVPQ